MLKFYFLNPRGNDDPVFLIVSPRAYPKLVAPPATHKEVEYKYLWIPDAEVLYNGDLPLTDIEAVLVPDIYYTEEFLAEQRANVEAAWKMMRKIIERRKGG